MSAKPIRVLCRFMFGLPYRQATQEEQARRNPLVGQLLSQWKSSGARLIGGFMTYGNAVDGMCHHLILEVDDLDRVQQMAQDIQGGEIGRFIERYDLHVGGGAEWEAWWKSA